MGFFTIILLMIIFLVAIYSFFLLELNKNIVHIDLLFMELDFQLGYVILISLLLGILIAIILEIIFFSSKKKNKNERS